MTFIITLLKELIESVIRNFRKLIALVLFSGNSETKNISVRGIHIKENFFSKTKCNEYIELIDSCLENEATNVWQDECMSDKRIYFANQIDLKFEKFYQDPYIRSILAKYTGTKKPNGMVLAAKVKASSGNLGSGGGWHRDSPTSHQFKAVCYLNDVNEENGPFQIIERSHHKYQILKAYFKQLLKPGKFRFTENEIDTYCKAENLNISSVLGKAGTLAMVDTKCIHRGKPLESGFRYVLFCYFWHGEIPAHFKKLMQRDS